MPTNQNPSRDGETNKDDGSERESRIHSEEVKERHTTHWDMDYMTSEEIEAAHREGQSDPADGGE